MTFLPKFCSSLLLQFMVEKSKTCELSYLLRSTLFTAILRAAIFVYLIDLAN